MILSLDQMPFYESKVKLKCSCFRFSAVEASPLFKKLQTVDLNEYIGVQYVIIVIIVLIFYDLLDLLLFEDSID